MQSTKLKCVITVFAFISFLYLPTFAAKKPATARGNVKKAVKYNVAKNNVVRLTNISKDHTIFAAALKRTGLDETLASGSGPYAIFAPSDKAFRALPQDVLNNLLNDKSKLKQFLLFHVVRAGIKPKHADIVSEIETMSGSNLRLTNENGKFKVNNTEVVSRGRKAANGIVYEINQTLFPIN